MRAPKTHEENARMYQNVTSLHPDRKIMLTKTFVRTFAGFCLLSNLTANAASVTTAQSPHSFALLDQYVIGGEGRWDLLSIDTKHRHLFISRSTHVQVVDVDARKLVGDLIDTDGVHGIALAEELDLGFTSNGKSNSVTVFDLKTLKVIDTIQISGVNPDVILYEPVSKHVFVFNGRSSDATVIDAASRKVIATIKLPGKPELAVSDETGTVFVNIEDKNEVTVIDSASNKVTMHFSIGSGKEPTGLAIDTQHKRLFSVCGNGKMIILDSKTGKLITEMPIGSGPDSAAFDPHSGIAFSSNGDGTLTLIKEEDPNHYTVAQTIVTKKGARTMSYDPTTQSAYLVTASFGKLSSGANKQERPPILPNSFEVMVVSMKP